MPRFYCDYCDAYLTHDSMSGRQQHMRGWKHRENFKLYYQQFYPQWIESQQMLQMQIMQQNQQYMMNNMNNPHGQQQQQMNFIPNFESQMHILPQHPNNLPQFRPPPLTGPPPVPLVHQAIASQI